MNGDPTRRFSSRADNYVKYRPGYPYEIIDLLRRECGLTADTVVADIGAGTGIFSKLLLGEGSHVLGVEPNAEMRAAGERLLNDDKRFVSIDGTAEATTLPDASVDIITAAQAMHWFDQARTRTEFTRILRPEGWIVLVWNDRQINSTPFLRDYETLVQSFSTDYAEVRHKELDLDRVCKFIGSNAVKSTVLPNRQVFDHEGLLGRLLSSSYAPEEGHPGYPLMRSRLDEIFQAHQVEGAVAFEYDTRVYYAQLPPEAPRTIAS